MRLDHVVDAQAERCGYVVEVLAVVVHRYFDVAHGFVCGAWSVRRSKDPMDSEYIDATTGAALHQD